MASTTSGGWVETVAQGVAIKLNPATMPHLLLSEQDGTFTFKRATWDDRAAGDDKSAPVPSFVGKRINDVFFARNRLGFLSGESVILSRGGGRFFDFFREKASQVLDTDPVDVASTEKDISVLHSAVPFDKDILMFAPKTQLRLSSGQEAFSPKTVEMKPVSRYENFDSVAPVSAGSKVFFGVDRGEFSGLMEYFVDGESVDAKEVTEHAPRYIPRGLTKIVVCTAERMVICRSELEPNALYVYSWFDSGNERVQSAWSRWSWPATDAILDIGVFAADLVLLIQRVDGLYIEGMSLASGRVDKGAAAVTYLDRRLTQDQCVVSYNPTNGTSRVTLPFPLDAIGQSLVQVWTKPQAGSPERPRKLHHYTILADTLAVAGNLTAAQFYVGTDFDSSYTLSEQFLRQQGVSRSDGRLQLRRGQVVHGMTGGYVVEVRDAERVLTEEVDLGLAASGAWEALQGFAADGTVFSGVSFNLTAPGDPLWTAYDEAWTGPLTGAVEGIPADGRYVIQLAGSGSTALSSAPVAAGGLFSFPSSPPGVKTLSVVRVADQTVIHSETFERGTEGGTLLVGIDLLTSLGIVNGVGLAVDTGLAKAGMLRAFDNSTNPVESAKTGSAAQAVAVLAATARGSQAQAETWLRGLSRCIQPDGSYPTSVSRPGAQPLTTDRPSSAAAWALLACANFVAAFPASSLVSLATALGTLTTSLLVARVVAKPIGLDAGDDSTATSLIAYQALVRSYTVFGINAASSAGATIGASLAPMWINEQGRYRTDASVYGERPITVDHIALTALWFSFVGGTNRARLTMPWLEYFSSTSGKAMGYARSVLGLEKVGDLDVTAAEVWATGSLYAILAKTATGDREGARKAYAALTPLFTPKGVKNVIDPATGRIVPWTSCMATALAVLAENPNGFLGVFGAPLRQEGPVTVEFTRPFSYRALEEGPSGAGTKDFPIDMKSTSARLKLKSLGALAFGFLSASWEGFFTTRSQKV